jgi:c-di-GMP-binding flagellar brake protein YcgR
MTDTRTDLEANRHPDVLDGIDERYVQRDAVQIAAMMRRLAERGQKVWISFGHDSGVFESAIAAVSTDGRTVYFPCAELEDVNAQLEAAGSLVGISQLDGVTIQFNVALMRQVTRAKAFASPMPRSLVRLQRRDFFRLVTSPDDGVTMALDVPSTTGAGPSLGQATAEVIDISGGGVALLLPARSMHLSEGIVLAGGILALPEVGQVEVAVRVRNIVRLVDDGGLTRQRVGCQFVQLRDAQLVLVQRFIRQVAVRRRERAR